VLLLVSENDDRNDAKKKENPSYLERRSLRKIVVLPSLEDCAKAQSSKEGFPRSLLFDRSVSDGVFCAEREVVKSEVSFNDTVSSNVISGVIFCTSRACTSSQVHSLRLLT